MSAAVVALADIAESASTTVSKLAVALDDDLVRAPLQLALDEAQEMFLIHYSTVVDVRVDLPDVIEIAVGHQTLHAVFFISIQLNVQVK